MTETHDAVLTGLTSQEAARRLAAWTVFIQSADLVPLVFAATRELTIRGPGPVPGREWPDS